MTPMQKWTATQFGQCLFIDATFKCNDAKFALFLPSVLDENFQVRPICYALVESDKAEDALDFLLGSMVAMCPALPATCVTVFSDKGIPPAAVKRHLPNASHLLCCFHIININVSSFLFKFCKGYDGKKFTSFLWSEFVHAKSPEAFEQAWAALTAANNPDRPPKNLIEYFEKEIKGDLPRVADFVRLRNLCFLYTSNSVAGNGQKDV